MLFLAAQQDKLIRDDLLAPLGGAAALLALLGMIILLPLFIAQRREIGRLREWHERNPGAGDQGPRPAAPATAGFRATGRMTAAERVTSERPALTRVGTAERAAIELEQAPFWRRVVIRGPRHPLVLSLIALVLAAGAIFAVGLLLQADSERGRGGGGVDPATVDVVILNASSSNGLAASVADDLAADDFNVTGTTVAQGSKQRSVVQYEKGHRAEARAVARRLGISVGGPFDPFAESRADSADVIVLAGEDLVGPSSGGRAGAGTSAGD